MEALLPVSPRTRINKGVAIENMHYLNDGLWRLKPVK